MMKLYDIISVFTILVVTIIAYLVSENIILSLAVFVCYMLASFIYVRKRIKSFVNKTERINNCCRFINSSILSLSSKPSLDDSFESIYKINSKLLNEYLESIDENSSIEKIEYLKNYFKLAIYNLYVNFINIVLEEGGNVLKVTSPLLKEVTRVERDLKENKSILTKKITEFLILWCITFGISIFLKFALNEFYKSIINSPISTTLISLFFTINLVSIILFVRSLTSYNEKELSYDKEI